MLRDPEQPVLVLQPMVDLARGVVAGYEALARFDSAPYRSPDQWFAAAGRLGCGSDLEARVLQRALHLRDSLPPGCFLSVNVSPQLLPAEPLQRVLGGADLHRLVLELTEHVHYDFAGLQGTLRRARAAGALVALDDAGSGYSGLQQLLAVRPDIVKLDRSLVAGLDSDEAKLALVEMLGSFAGSLDAWVVAEGVETEGELVALSRLGVPLAQGWFFGQAAAPWPQVGSDTAALVRHVRSRAQRHEQVAGLLEPVPAMEFAPPARPGSPAAGSPGAPRLSLPDAPVGQAVPVVDSRRCPWALLLPLLRHDEAPGHRLVVDLLRATPATGVAELARRVLARPPSGRFDPVVCTDDEGRYLGLVRVERLLSRLVEFSAGPEQPMPS